MSKGHILGDDIFWLPSPLNYFNNGLNTKSKKEVSHKVNPILDSLFSAYRKMLPIEAVFERLLIKFAYSDPSTPNPDPNLTFTILHNHSVVPLTQPTCSYLLCITLKYKYPDESNLF